MSPRRRGCLFSHESNLQHFDSYSQASCILECSWTEAIKECVCVPWYISTIFPDQDTCEIYGRYCFEKIISERLNGNSSCTTNCKQDCISIETNIEETFLDGKRVNGPYLCENSTTDEICSYLYSKEIYLNEVLSNFTGTQFK